jgi:hypothetical protein
LQVLQLNLKQVLIYGGGNGASDLITIGTVKVAACGGNSALTNFPALVSNGGV